MTKTLSLKKNASWVFMGKVVYIGSQWAMLVVLAKLGSPEMVGQFVFGLAITAPVFMLTNLQLRGVQATDANRDNLFGDFLCLRLISTLIAVIVITIIVFLFGYKGEAMMVILALACAKGIESVSDLFYGLFQQHERLDKISKSMMIKGPLSLIFFGAGIYLTGQVFWGVFGLAVAWLIILGCYDIRNGYLILRDVEHLTQGGESLYKGLKRIRPHWNFEVQKKLVWVALPLGFVMMFGSLNANIPLYFVKNYFGEGKLGIFSAMAYVMLAGTTVMSALWESATPRLAKNFSTRKKKAFSILIIKLMGVGAICGLLGVFLSIWIGRDILSLLYSPKYAEYANVFTLLMVVTAVQYIGGALSIGVTAMRKFWIQTPINIANCLLTLILSFIFIPRFGLIGAAWTLLVATCFSRIIFGFVLIHGLVNSKAKKSGEVHNVNKEDRVK